MRTYIYIVFTIFALNVAKCASMSRDELVDYVAKYGYAGGKAVKDMNTEEKQKVIKDFQKTFFLPATGDINAETESMVNRPRCGRPDDFQEIENRNGLVQKWPKNTLTYKLINRPLNGLSKSATLKEITKSLDIWAEHVPLKFEYKPHEDVDIEFTFNAPTDKMFPSNTILAYAYGPPIGDVFFNTVNWTIKSEKGYELLTTAAHEVGHSLGLSHSHVKEALMYPYKQPYDPNFRLHNDDISRMQNIYGKNKIDAAFLDSKGYLYLIVGDKCLRYRNRQLSAGYPKLISEKWPGLPSPIDAAYYYKKNIYFLKDSRAWVYDGAVKTYESDMSTRNVDAAFTIGDRLYMFSGSQYWRYNHGRVENPSDFPREISSFWKGVPPPIDAAYYDLEQYIYFFKDNLVYKFDKNSADQEATSQTIADWVATITKQ